MPTNFIKISTLIILLFYNETVFGMMSSNTAPLNFFSQGIDFIEKKYFPLLPCKDKLNLRATCIALAITLTNDQFSKIYNQFNDEKKQIASSCAFLHCIKEKKYQEVEWFLKNEIHNPLFNIGYLDNDIKYFAINPLELIENNDLKMKELFAAYHYDTEKFVKSLKKIQEKYCEPFRLNEKLQNWQRASNDRNIFGKTIDPISNDYNKTISAREYREKELFYLIHTDYSSKLIVAACIGDLVCFNNELIAYEDRLCLTTWDFLSMYQAIVLSLFAAIKNKDLDLIRFILTQPLYADDMKSDISGLLSYFLLNTPVEYSEYLIISKDKCFEGKHIQWIKQLIEEDMFTAIPKMIKNNKDNEQIKEIYELLMSNIYGTFNQREKVKKYNKFCLIQ